MYAKQVKQIIKVESGLQNQTANSISPTEPDEKRSTMKQTSLYSLKENFIARLFLLINRISAKTNLIANTDAFPPVTVYEYFIYSNVVRTNDQKSITAFYGMPVGGGLLS